MSRQVEYSVEPRRTSGGLYHKVTTSLEYVWLGTDLALARPVGYGNIKRLDGHEKNMCFKLKCSSLKG